MAINNLTKCKTFYKHSGLLNDMFLLLALTYQLVRVLRHAKPDIRDEIKIILVLTFPSL